MTRYLTASRLTERDRFWLRVHVASDSRCWEWQGKRGLSGHGLVKDGDVWTGAHRKAWEYVNGPIPDGMQVLHRCDNPPCVNAVEHLFLGTQADNMQDMHSKGRARPNPRRGPNAAHAVLTPELAQQMLRARASGVTQKELAAYFGVSMGTVYNVLTGKHWTVAS